MENPKRSLINKSLEDGLILGGVIVFINFISYLIIDLESISFMALMSVGVIVGILPLIIGLVYFIKKYKKVELGGVITLNQGIKYGVLVTFIVALFSCVYNITFNNFIAPDYVKESQEIIAEKTIGFMQDMNVPDEAIEETLNKLEEERESTIKKSKFVSPILSIPGTVVIGLIISLIISAIIKTKKPPFSEVV
ncbi:DUF4199 domain-containing protein [Saccharicrinis aurantiacus]|uniref:DUF4199 domain-containing protein n=1 Tax=Saccharicrinis aurantiacus TaxID=1849719 RepID=UPI002491A520|nr:DUF4199 domain-containing protein [Saccharicrinis aurantiacus]